MKIHLDGCDLNSTSGPNSLALRLSKCLIENGHELEFNDGSNCAVSLVFIEPTGARLAKKTAQRIDGLWFKQSEFYTKNVNIKKMYDKADAIVFQSNFDQTFVTKWWGYPKIHTVIRNGIHQEKISKFTSTAFEQIRNSYKKVFVCAANWHLQKRLRDNTELFKHIRNTIEPSSCLIVLGNNPDHVCGDKDIFYAGSLSHKLCLEVYSMSDWMIHIAFLDHCPNTVIECLSQETPVICTDEGGTKELVQDFGVVLKEPKKYEFTLEDYDNPPKIDVTQLRSLPNKQTLGKHIDIEIENVMKQYVNLFESLL